MAVDYSLEGLFSILGAVCEGAPLPLIVQDNGVKRDQGDLFGDDPVKEAPGSLPASYLEAKAGEDIASEFFELSADGYHQFIQGWMSEAPILQELIYFGERIILAGREAAERERVPSEVQLAARRAALRAATDRGDAAIRQVLDAAFKVGREIDRMRGLLRFSPNAQGVYLAQCEPDHFILPALGGHFSRRFGEKGAQSVPWAIVDLKRRLVLSRFPGEEISLESLDAHCSESPAPEDPWADLWKTYHRAVTIEERINPELQRRFMPRRYWKYLLEMG